MKISFHLSWFSGRTNPSRCFKQKHAYGLLTDYLDRMNVFARCETAGMYSAKAAGRAGSKLILCDKNPPAVMLTSEQLAAYLSKLQNSGTRELHVVIGGADGFKAAEVKALNPDLIWSFGPLTLPHELACVVAAEQLYRAYCILNRLPYHCQHD